MIEWRRETAASATQRLAATSRPITNGSSPTVKIPPLSLPEIAESRGCIARDLLRLFRARVYAPVWFQTIDRRVFGLWTLIQGGTANKIHRPNTKDLSNWIDRLSEQIVFADDSCLSIIKNPVFPH